MKFELRLLIILSLLSMAACQVLPPASPAPEATPSPLQIAQETPTPPEGAATPAATPTEIAPTSTPLVLGQLNPVPERPRGEFAPLGWASWTPPAEPPSGIRLPASLDDVPNAVIVNGLTNSQRRALIQNGFVVVRTRDEHFASVRHRISNQYGQPYFLTTDAAFHALHIAVEELRLALDREELRPLTLQLVNAILNETFRYVEVVKDTPLEETVRLAAAYLGVGLRLMDPQAELHPSLEYRVRAQVEQVLAARGPESLVLFPGVQEDFRSCVPTGRFVGDAALEGYSRALCWFQRVGFPLESQEPGFEPSQVPLIITLAALRAETETGPAVQEWARLDDLLTFLDGETYDDSLREYGRLIEQVYGAQISPLDLADEGRWQQFLTIGRGRPPVQMDLAFASLPAFERQRSWRLFPIRLSPDTFITQSLISDRVGTPDRPRYLPSGLDVMAALDSAAAMTALRSAGALDFPNYLAQMGDLQSSVQARSSEQWLSTLFGSWAYSWLPQLSAKEQSYFPFMQTSSWGYKELNTALSSWVELKHEPSLVYYPIQESGASRPPSSPPAPAFVEPNPEVFYRLAYIAGVLAEGLDQRGFSGREDRGEQPPSLYATIAGLRGLALRLRQLGDIAAKELAGLTLQAEDYAIIQTPLGAEEERAFRRLLTDPTVTSLAASLNPVPGVALLSGAQGRNLQIATGMINRLYILVPLEGEVYIAQGGVYSYYEFPQSGAALLTDTIWRQVLKGSPPKLPTWSEQFVLEGGNPQNVLFFRLGDVYRITTAGSGLNLLQSPSIGSVVLRTLQPGDYVTIIGGPVDVNNEIWWKFRLNLTGSQLLEGWLKQDASWFERAWGQ